MFRPLLFRPDISAQLWAQGVSRLERSHILAKGHKSLNAIADILGDKVICWLLVFIRFVDFCLDYVQPFLFGEEPALADVVAWSTVQSIVSPALKILYKGVSVQSKHCNVCVFWFFR
jgi:hypothetical protein